MLIGDTILQESDVKVLTDEELEFVVYDTGKYASLEDPSWKICIFDEEKVSFPCAVKDLPMEKRLVQLFSEMGHIVKKFSLTEISSPEIEDTGWFDYAALPEMTSPGTRRRLAEYFTNQPPSEAW